MEDTANGIRGARLVAEFADGSMLERIVLLPKGDAANPFTWEDMARKLEVCMQGFAYLAETVTGTIQALNFETSYTGIKALLG